MLKRLNLMNTLKLVLKTFKMLYNILCCSINLASFLFNLFWFLCTFASAVVPWFTLILVLCCVASKFIKLKSPNEKLLINLLGGDSANDLSYWPIANHGFGYDHPENSKVALEKCITNGVRNVLLDVSLTNCGEIIILNRTTLEKAGLSGGISKYNWDLLKKINISELHSFGSHFNVEYIMTLKNVLDFIETNNLTIFLLISDSSTRMLDKFKTFIRDNNKFFAARIILVSRSPIVIYQLRKIYPQLICGLWTEKSLSLTILKTSTLITSIYGALFRNIIAPVIGISLVFINKDEFNLHIGELWRNVGIRPIVYNVNSPNEKRYFQKSMKTQYLTDSLRSEPQLIIKS